MSLSGIQASPGVSSSSSSSPNFLDRIFEFISKIFSCFQSNVDTPQHSPRPLRKERVVYRGQTSTTPRQNNEKQTQLGRAESGNEKKGPDVAKLERVATETLAEVERKLGEISQAEASYEMVANGDAYVARLVALDNRLARAGKSKVFTQKVIQLRSILDAKRKQTIGRQQPAPASGKKVRFAPTATRPASAPQPEKAGRDRLQALLVKQREFAMSGRQLPVLEIKELRALQKAILHVNP
ncbi:MAG: hypothetical protein P0S96_04960 [Simkaniaceae bacterium]|nr:hypothetical protein [Candidatus Sacchlamyda saccharinae]